MHCVDCVVTAHFGLKVILRLVDVATTVELWAGCPSFVLTILVQLEHRPFKQGVSLIPRVKTNGSKTCPT